MDRVSLVSGGSYLFAFDDAGLARVQATMMIGANLDVETFTMPADTWNNVRGRLMADDTITVTETFTRIKGAREDGGLL